jgi:hypothetical protein
MTPLLSYSLRVVASALPPKYSIASAVGRLSATPKHFLANRLRISYWNYIAAMAKLEDARSPPALPLPSAPNDGKFKIALCQLSVTEGEMGYMVDKFVGVVKRFIKWGNGNRGNGKISFQQQGNRNPMAPGRNPNPNPFRRP